MRRAEYLHLFVTGVVFVVWWFFISVLSKRLFFRDLLAGYVIISFFFASSLAGFWYAGKANAERWGLRVMIILFLLVFINRLELKEHFGDFDKNVYLKQQLVTADFILHKLPPDFRLYGFVFWQAPEIFILTQKKIENIEDSTVYPKSALITAMFPFFKPLSERQEKAEAKYCKKILFRDGRYIICLVKDDPRLYKAFRRE